MIRPSSLPMLQECPKFEGAGSEFADAGTKRHEAIAAFLSGNEDAFLEFDDEDREHLLWAADYVKLKAPLLDAPLELEQKRAAVLPTGQPIQGTPDMICGDQLFDLKWRPRDYMAQMAAYAYMVLAEGKTPEVTAHIMYAQTETVRRFTFDTDRAWAVIKPILDTAAAPFAVPVPCSYCGWCAKKLTCTALIQQVNIATKSNPEWDLPQWHSSQMTTAEEIGQALKIARTLADWCESVEYHAKELAIKQGIVATGFKLTSRKGNRFITDVKEAFRLASLPQEEFLKACTVKPRLLFDLYAAFYGMKKAPAEREVERRLGEFIQRKETTMMLTQEKPQKD